MIQTPKGAEQQLQNQILYFLKSCSKQKVLWVRGGMSKGGAKDPNSANKLETRQRLRERAQTKLSEKQRKAPVKSKENKGCKKKRSHMRSYPSKEADPRSHRGAVRGRQEAQEEEQHQPWTGEGGDVGKLLFNISQLCVSLLSVWQRRAATLHPARSDRVSPWTACERYMKPQTWGHSCEPISPTWAFLKRVSYYINTSVFYVRRHVEVQRVSPCVLQLVWWRSNYLLWDVNKHFLNIHKPVKSCRLWNIWQFMTLVFVLERL